MNKLLLSLLFSLLVSTVFSQGPQQRTCGTMEALEQLKANDPSIAVRMQHIESQVASYIDANSKKRSSSATVTVPVVFHIVYNKDVQNISDAQCIAQIEQLNLDFTRQNTDATNTPSAFASVAANTGIQFCLAKRTPTGGATSGIERRKTNKSSFGTNDGVKFYSKGGLDAWPASSYLNIWVCKLGQSLLGYAQFPGGPASTDGVVVLYSSVGSMQKPGTASRYDLGRTATHEVGHWLNYYHTWGDDGTSCSGSDKVSETPNQAGSTFACPAYPKTDACSPSAPGIQFMNYMDYTDDACMNMFSNGQSLRSSALFASGGVRASILTSSGCTAPTAALNNNIAFRNSAAEEKWTAVTDISIYPNPSQGAISIAFRSGSESSVSIRISDMIGKTFASKTVLATEGQNQMHFDLSDAGKGIYFVEVANASQRFIQRLILDK